MWIFFLRGFFFCNDFLWIFCRFLWIFCRFCGFFCWFLCGLFVDFCRSFVIFYGFFEDFLWSFLWISCRFVDFLWILCGCFADFCGYFSIAHFSEVHSLPSWRQLTPKTWVSCQVYSGICRAYLYSTSLLYEWKDPKQDL